MLPTSLSQITLKTYASIDRILKDPDLDTARKDTLLLALLSGKTEAEIHELTLQDRNRLLQKLDFLNEAWEPTPTLPKSREEMLPDQQPTDRQPSKLSKPSKPSKLSVKGQRFHVITDAGQLTGGQYIDLMNFLKDPDALLQNIHNVLAVICLPLKFGILRQKYKGSEHARVARLFLGHLTVADALPVLVFFCRLSRHLTPGIMDYLNRQTRTRMQQLQDRMQDIISSTAGSPSSMPSATATAGHGSSISI
jgi:hypothetical protein